MVPLVGYLMVFVAVGAGFLLINLLVGKLIRPNRPNDEKATIYECGEPTIGSAWVQFDLRYYVVALLFVIFDVEVAFFFPWADVFGKANAVAKVDATLEKMSQREQAEYHNRLRALGGDLASDPSQAEVAQNARTASKLAWLALFDILVFFGVLLIGFAYLWKRGDLQWVRTVSSPAVKPIPVVERGERRVAETAAS